MKNVYNDLKYMSEFHYELSYIVRLAEQLSLYPEARVKETRKKETEDTS
jgi:hypothetical protein